MLLHTLLSAAALTFPSEAGEARPAATAGPSPRLIVLVAVDQMIPEQFERLGVHMDGGLGRLWREGRVHLDASLPYARTETGAGHVTFGTGCLPRTHGVVGNSFWDRVEGRERYCVEDKGVSLVTSGGIVETTGQRSPSTILSPTLGVLLQRIDAEAKVVTVSSKDRAAIGICGDAAGLALWWDKGRGGFGTSTHYCQELPAAVDEWNAGWEARARAFVWDDTSPLEKVGGDHGAWGTATDDRPGERPLGRLGTTMPYVFAPETTAAALARLAYETPMADGFVADLAGRLVPAFELGQDDAVDLLAVSFSGCDTVGHANGPYSREVTDLLFRLDRSLGALFETLDSSVGEGRWMAALTADHGVLPLPEHLQARGVDARRVGSAEVRAMRATLVERANERLGVKLRVRSASGGLRLDEGKLAGTGVTPERARHVLAEELRGLRGAYPWIDDAYSMDEIAAFAPDQLGVRALVANTFHPDRTPDVIVVNAPGVLVGVGKGTSHGSPHPYDRDVPLIFYGPGFEAERVPGDCGSHDVVPTLLQAAGLEMDATFDGRALQGEPEPEPSEDGEPAGEAERDEAGEGQG